MRANDYAAVLFDKTVAARRVLSVFLCYIPTAIFFLQI